MFNKEEYWKRRNNIETVTDEKTKKKSKVHKPLRGQGDLPTPKMIQSAPVSIEDGKVVAQNRATRRNKVKKYSFYHRKGYYDDKGAIRINRRKNGVNNYKFIPVTIDAPEDIKTVPNQ